MIHFTNLPKDIQTQALSYMQINDFPAVKDLLDYLGETANITIIIKEEENPEAN